MIFEEDKNLIKSEIAQLVMGTDSSNHMKNKKNLEIKSTGRFYTHQLIGEQLVDSIFKNASSLAYASIIKVIDPFCGDGRLIEWLLCSSHKFNNRALWEIDLWDIDFHATLIAKDKVTKIASELGLEVKVNTVICDAFENASDFYNEFDICLTNPPWENIKPDKRDMEALDKEASEEYIKLLRERDTFLTNLFPLSAPTKRFAGWGLNLARCGTEVAIKLTKKTGICGIVSPSSLIADQTSEPLRQWIFENNEVYEVAYYEAEARLFENVDQSCITLTIGPQKQTNSVPKLTYYNKNHKKESINISDNEWSSVKNDSYVIPLQFGVSVLNLKPFFQELKQLTDYEGLTGASLWSGRELDQTNIEKNLSSSGVYKFLRGKMISRYKIVECPNSYVNERNIKIPASSQFYRIAWRDVSRPTQKRRMIATIVPPGIVTGNSLSLIYYRDNNLKKLKSLLAIMNSLVFETQVRMNSTTNHVSLGTVRKAFVPDLNSIYITNTLSDLLDKFSETNSTVSEADLEVEVAKVYNLKFNEFSDILSLYPKISAEEKLELLEKAKIKL